MIYGAFLYVAKCINFEGNVKIGITTQHPKKRVPTTFNFHKISIGPIYQIINTNRLTLNEIDKQFKKENKNYEIVSETYDIFDNRPTEFYLPICEERLENFLGKLKYQGQIEYIKSNNLIEFEKNYMDISGEILYDLTNNDPDYK